MKEPKIGMKYQQYEVTLTGERGKLEKKLGILGEAHVYRPEETALAEEKVSEYQNLAIEGCGKKTLKQLVLLPYSLLIGIFLKSQGRSFDNTTARDFAKKQRKNIQYFEDTKYIGLGRTALTASLPFLYIATLPLWPFMYVGRKIAEKVTGKEIEPLHSRILSFATASKKREKHMGRKTIDYLMGLKDLLVNCGRAHMEGIVKRITSDSRVKSIKKIGNDIFPNYSPIYGPVPKPAYAY